METIKENQALEAKFKEYVDYFSLTDTDIHKTILDVGTGKGDFIKYLRTVIGNTSAYGIESDEKVIPKNAEGLIRATGLNIPFADETFELVTAKNYMSMFLPQKLGAERALMEILRVLKHGGKFIADVSAIDNERADTQRFIEQKGRVGHQKELEERNERQAGSKDFFRNLTRLNNGKHRVNLNEKTDGNTILTIEKL